MELPAQFIARHIILIVILYAFNGCGGIPVATHPTEKYVDRNEASALIGSTKEEVIQHFGKPDWQLPGVDKSYFIYSSSGVIDAMWDIFFPYLILPAEVYGDHGWEPIFCSIFEFNKSGVLHHFDSNHDIYYLREYDEDDESFSLLDLGSLDYLKICLHQFFSDKEVDELLNSEMRYRAEKGDIGAAVILAREYDDTSPLRALAKHSTEAKVALNMIETNAVSYTWKGLGSLSNLSEIKLKQMAQHGNVEAQYTLYWVKDPQAITWLCRAANKGHAEARYRLCTILRERAIFLELDMISPYVWCSLATARGHTQAWSLANQMRWEDFTADQVDRASRLLLEWQPDNCKELNNLLEKEWQELPDTLKKKAKRGDMDAHVHLYYDAKNMMKKKELMPELQSRAKSGDAEAQFELYYLDEKDPLKWLCRAADQGHTRAEMWLGYLFETGSYGFSRDYAQSYFWYRRAAIGLHPQEIEKMVEKFEGSDRQELKKKPKLYFCKSKDESCTIARKIAQLKNMLGTEGVSKTELMLEQWKPGDCEKGLLSIETRIGDE